MRQAWAEDSGGFGGGGFAGGGLSFPALTPVVKRLLIANFAIWVVLFLVDLLAPGLNSTTVLSENGSFRTGLIPIFGLAPLNWFQGFPFVYPWQFVSYGFLHSPGSLWHIFGNSLGLYFFGTMLEGTLGSRRFLGFYLIAIVLAGIGSALFKIVMGNESGTIGASGGVYACIFAAATMRPRATVIFWFFPLPLMWLAFGLLLINVVPLLQEVVAGRGGGMDTVAHLAGAGFG
ncbi:MAG: rhomboid family intramembrane serine protease, partial [Planctomycetota bacterium]